MSKPFYNNESTISSKIYSERLNKAFNMLRKYNREKSQRDYFEILFNQIYTNNVQSIYSIK